MSAWTIGIDPGLHGALAAYDGESIVEMRDMPTFDVGKGKSHKLILDEQGLAIILRGWAPQCNAVWLEQVGVRPGEGAVGAFSFGRSYGLIRGICAALQMRMNDVTPQVWKKALRVTGDKDHSRQRASAILPTAAHHWPLKKHDGRAEAALIGLYGYQRLQSSIAPLAPQPGAGQ